MACTVPTNWHREPRPQIRSTKVDALFAGDHHQIVCAFGLNHLPLKRPRCGAVSCAALCPP